MTRFIFAILFFISSIAWADEELVIVSPHWEGIRREFTRAFTEHWKVKTGKTVELRWLDLGGTSDILRYVKGEFRKNPETSGLDLFFGGGIDPFIELKKQGLLKCGGVDRSILESIPKEISGNPLRDPDECWYAASLAGFGIVYNKAVLKLLNVPEPLTWEDAARPELFSWVNTADPRKSGSVHMVYELILQAYGWDKGWKIISGIGANARGFSAASSQTPRDVGLGEAALGFAIDSYAREASKNAGPENIGFVIPEGLSIINGDGIAILKGAPHGEIAKEFLSYVLSEEGQKLLLYKKDSAGGPKLFSLGRMSVVPKLYEVPQEMIAADSNPFKQKIAFTYDSAKGSARWNVVNDLIGTFVIDVHSYLQNAAKAGAVFRSPISEADVEKIVRSGDWDTDLLRNQVLSEWNGRARGELAKYSKTSIVKLIPVALLLIGGVYLIISKFRSSRA